MAGLTVLFVVLAALCLASIIALYIFMLKRKNFIFAIFYPVYLCLALGMVALFKGGMISSILCGVLKII